MFDFPASPTPGQEFTPSGGSTYVWNNYAWVVKPKTAAAGLTISETPPASPVAGQLWWESDSGKLFVWYADANSSQWVEASNLRADLSGYVKETSGLFTPVVYGSTSAGVGTYTTQLGRWTRHGRIAFIEISTTWSAHTGTGNMFVGGTPFSSIGNPSAVICSVYGNGLAFTGQLTGYVSANLATGFGIQTFANNGAAASLPMDTAANLQINAVFACNEPQ